MAPTRRRKVKIGTGGTPPPSEQVIMEHTFDDWTSGAVSQAYWNTKMGNGGNLGGLAFISIVNNPLGGKMMRHTLKANEDGGASGPTMEVTLPVATRKTYIEYDIRFTSTVSGGVFDLGGGGKIPGLGGETSDATFSPTGGNYPGDTGWSGRGMWVTPKTYSARAYGEGLLYYYAYDQTDKIDPAYGDNIWWGSSNVFVPGQWHHIKMLHELNDIGVSNAIHKVWFDNNLVVNLSTKRTRNRDDLLTNKLYWSLFVGGNAESWWIDEDSWVDLDNLRIVTY